MKILIVDDNRDFCSTIADVVRGQGWHAETFFSPETALNHLERHSREIGLMLLDIEFGSESDLTGLDVLDRSVRQYPHIPVIMISGKGTIETAVRATKLGALNFIDKSSLSNERLIDVLESAMERVRQDSSNDELRRVIETHGIIGRSTLMMEVADKILRYGRTDLNVLITGETGTGKKLVAQALHAVSKRSKYQFITVDIPNIPRELFQSELFGHVKGAFSGAMEHKRGLFHQAHKGTLFMDEIGDMPLELQANLLLPTEQKAVRRVGSVETEDVDIRFVSATDRDLVGAMQDGRFREQLYHRLRECEIFIPSLRERKDDIQLILDHYLARHNREMGDHKTVAPAAMDYLMAYDWPGNVRELASVLRVALQTTATDQLEVTDLHRILARSVTQSRPGFTTTSHASAAASIAPAPAPAAASAATAPSVSANDTDILSADRTLRDDLAMVDRLKIEKTLERTAGNVSKAAAILGVSRETLHNKIRKYGIDVQTYRTR
ncbi:MAG: sigma-54 dependent transcriptional regulator [Candidatus Kapabacteria bacterium]|jgi:DNA-binding NtrC family response regulator|nr:sigma-54 dependent transcriptional regulator [Candidatus Kapabacteria bacterium]